MTPGREANPPVATRADFSLSPLRDSGVCATLADMGRVDDSFLMHLSDLLAPWAAISPRRMFGGWGVYRGALMFALVSDDVAYFKCGAELRAVAGERDLRLFTYEKPAAKGKKKKVSLGYAEVPPDVLEDSAVLCAWAEAAWQDALAGRRLNAAPKRKPIKR